MMRKYLVVVITTLGFFIPETFGQRVNIPWPEVKDSSDIVDTHSKPVVFQVKRTWTFSHGLHCSNEFAGARLNEAEEINDSTVEITIRPENYPINMSPWYAFKLWSKTPETVYLKLKYVHGRHRYYPKTSKDGITWSKVPEKDYFSDETDSTAFFRVYASRDTLWVSAQELMTSHWLAGWVAGLSEKPWVSDTIFGYSTQKRPLRAMFIGNTEASHILLILGRQHPPEVTGCKEMVSFVETLAGNGTLARKFRKDFCIIVAPMMNPDGVDNGHWRHNAGGIDLNRDWRWFNQPETYALRQFVLNTLKKTEARIVYGVDFHSTQTDLFYMPDASETPNGISLTTLWIQKINRKFPNHPFSPEPSGLTGQISKNWIMHELHAEAITYEVGDNTDREVIRKRGRASAKFLMKILLRGNNP